MTLIEQIRALLRIYGVDDTAYTDTQIELLASQARTLISEEISSTEREDYRNEYMGKVYMTDYYPILDVDEVTVVVDGETITPRKITDDGIIYFQNVIHGELTCTYTQGLSADVIEPALALLVVHMVQNKNGTVGSITEGDISISYDNTSNLTMNSQIDRLLGSLRSKYKARVRLL